MDGRLQLQDPLLRHVLAVWQAAARAGAGSGEGAAGLEVPDHRAVDPVALGRALPFVWICERDPASRRFRYRLAGERINDVYRRSLAGLYLDDIIPAASIGIVQRRYDDVLDQPAALRTAGLVYLRNERTFLGERLILPLGDGAGAPARVLGATVYELLPGSRPPPPGQTTRVVRLRPRGGEHGWVEDLDGRRIETLA